VRVVQASVSSIRRVGKSHLFFYGAYPNPKFAMELQRNISARAMGAPAGSCKVVDGVYRPSQDNVRVLKVQAACAGHYFTCQSRICGGACGGWNSGVTVTQAALGGRDGST